MAPFFDQRRLRKIELRGREKSAGNEGLTDRRPATVYGSWPRRFCQEPVPDQIGLSERGSRFLRAERVRAEGPLLLEKTG